ncbi:hypothetical protein EJ04DRAFT_601067 [Polyplosphaeria fusca]|uniref:Glycosyltransferase family 69 protein n=1 Tax=Polyplosphaeria fusca TaxID=682080 RepID=A0A9P4R1U0_9PLEO|nr:hypothetical protein EJ04DRAFT_601067 [Polyplosphaeria fusca]
MAPEARRSEEYELLPRTSTDSASASDTDLRYQPTPRKLSFLRLATSPWSRQFCLGFRNINSKSRPSTRKRRSSCRIFRSIILVLAGCITVLIIFTGVFLPSYTHLPEHYKALQRTCAASSQPGRGNINNEKVFIAAALYDPNGELVGGDWGRAVLKLLDLLGPDNVHLSVYENDADTAANVALKEFEKKLKCNSSITSGHLPLEDIPRITVPTGERRMKRIAFLAEVRNRALRPLHANPAIRYDRLLYINDVMFNPIDAVHLLFSTNIDDDGRAQYGAVCAVDFINAFKFYDRFATRDFEGYAMGIPFYPWFTDAGDAVSRKDVLEQKDAVRVRACWGGMTAFEAKWFTETRPTEDSFSVSPLQFRYEDDPFWDASECCLIHADLTYLRHGHDIASSSGIFTNPYIRVAYDSRSLGWLGFTRRFERLYSPIHNMLNHLVGMPFWNGRRLEQPGEKVVEKVWSWDKKSTGEDLKGSYHDVERIVLPGRFCGGRALLVLNDEPKPGEKKWMTVPLPALPP